MRKSPFYIFTLILMLLLSLSLYGCASGPAAKPALSADEEVKIYCDRAAALKKQGKADQALAEVNRALELNPRLADGFELRGDLHREKGRVDEALADYARALAIDPRRERVYAQRAVIYGDRKQYDQAIAELSQAIRLNPASINYYMLRAAIYGKKDALDQALTDLDRVISLNPKVAMAYQYRASIYLHQKKVEKARADVKKLQDMGAKVWPWIQAALEKETGSKGAAGAGRQKQESIQTYPKVDLVEVFPKVEVIEPVKPLKVEPVIVPAQPVITQKVEAKKSIKGNYGRVVNLSSEAITVQNLKKPVQKTHKIIPKTYGYDMQGGQKIPLGKIKVGDLVWVVLDQGETVALAINRGEMKKGAQVSVPDEAFE